MLWLSDYLATALFSKVEAPLLIQRFINPNFRNAAPDAEIVQTHARRFHQRLAFLKANWMLGAVSPLVNELRRLPG